MKVFTGIKSLIIKQMHDVLAAKAQDAILAIASAKESRNNDTKSSAGDKYETGRAMMQMEIDNNEMQLSKTRLQQQELSKIDGSVKNEIAVIGSLVKTNFENYFIAIAMGKLTVGKEVIYAISPASPIGSFLKNKKTGDRGEFNGRHLIIENIE